MTESATKSQKYCITTIFIFTLIPALTYFYFVARYTPNAPFMDDFYDSLFTIIHYQKSTSFLEKIKSLT